MNKKLNDKVALITGATRGLGAAVAEEFAKQGAQLILIGRKTQDLEEIDDIIQTYGHSAMLVPLDLNKSYAMDEIAQAIAQRYGKLDIIVGNAGVLGHIGPMTDSSPTDWQEVMEVNLNANWRLLKACDPLLKKSPAGRAIFVSSGVTHRPAPFWGAYAVSKAALEVMVKTYAAETVNTYPNLKVNILNPGALRTKMRAQAMPGEDPMSLPEASTIVSTFVDLASDSCAHHGDVINAQG